MKDEVEKMLDIARKALLMGLGAASITKEKTEQLVNELVHKGRVSQTEARDYIEQIIERGKEEQSQLRELIRSELQKILNEMPVVSRKEYQELEIRLAELEAKNSKAE